LTSSELSLKEKILGTMLVLVGPFFCCLYLLDIHSETISFECRPRPEEVICKINNEAYLAGSRNLEIPKLQIVRLEVIKSRAEHSMKLITIDGKEISLARGRGGFTTDQLELKIESIKAFIINPESKVFTIEVQRNFLLLFILAGAISLFHYLWIKRLWVGRI
jgi:hypothetical protein